jgi:hypothetical protein
MRDGERVVPAEDSWNSIEPVVSVLRERGATYLPVKRLPGGAWGAWLVRNQNDDVAVLKCIWDSDWRSRLESARRVVDLLRARDAPVPRYLASGFDRQVGTWCLQEHLPGDRVEELDMSLVGEVLRFSDLQAGIGTKLSLAYNWSRQVMQWMEAKADPTIESMSAQSQQG